jgi:transcriptional regulator GlxA family with amidase domain
MSTGQGRSRRGLLRNTAAATLGAWSAGAVAGPAAAAGHGTGADPTPGPGGAGAAAERREPERLDMAVLLYDGLTALDAVGPYETLCRVPGLRVTTVGLKAGPVRTDTGELGLVVDRPLRSMPRPDILLVPGGGRGTVEAAADARILGWVRRVHRHTRWTTSVCTGSLILGAAGLLKGLPATTHWASRTYLESLGAVYRPGRFVEAGKIITAAGVSAGVDMGLHLTARLSGERVAQAMQLALEYDPHPPYDTGSPEKADAELQALALKLIDDAGV